LPESLTIEAVVVFPILIEVAPIGEAGSREKHQPRTITAEELGAAMKGQGLEEKDSDEE
jgi:hypothetical protein